MIQLEFTKIREVKSPNRANEGDAGLDFYIPKLSEKDILRVGEKDLRDMVGINRKMYSKGYIKFNGMGTDDLYVIIKPHGRLLIPSGITGEMHIGIQNNSPEEVWIPLQQDKKIMQFIHVPILLSNPIEIPNEEYEEKAKDWGTRGDKGFGAHDNK